MRHNDVWLAPTIVINRPIQVLNWKFLVVPPRHAGNSPFPVYRPRSTNKENSVRRYTVIAHVVRVSMAACGIVMVATNKMDITAHESRLLVRGLESKSEISELIEIFPSRHGRESF